MSPAIFYGPKNVRATEIGLYMSIEALKQPQQRKNTSNGNAKHYFSRGNISVKDQLHRPNGFWGDDVFWGFFWFAMATNTIPTIIPTQKFMKK